MFSELFQNGTMIVIPVSSDVLSTRLEMGLREWTWCVPRHKNMLALSKTYFFVNDIEKYVEDVKQDEKHVPDLLEPIMRPTCLLKDEIRPILFKIFQFRPKVTKIRV